MLEQNSDEEQLNQLATNTSASAHDTTEMLHHKCKFKKSKHADHGLFFLLTIAVS